MKLTEEMSITMSELVAAHGGEASLVERIRNGEPVTTAEVGEALRMTSAEVREAFAALHCLRTGKVLTDKSRPADRAGKVH